MVDFNSIDWTNPEAMVSDHFSVRETCLLPSWGVIHVPSDEEKANIYKHACKMDIVREQIGKPIHVHCWIRPKVANCPGSQYNGQDYNAHVGGASHSSHILGLAIDFDIGEDCNENRKQWEPMLEKWDMRMENLAGPWVHLSSDWEPGKTRFFIP